MDYEEFVLQQAPNIANIESGLRSISYFLPGRFKEAEVLSEALFSSTKLIGLYHDTILEKEANRQQPRAPTSFNRYTRALFKNSLYKKLCWILTLIKSFEVSMEMIAFKKFGRKQQSRTILFIEIIKLILRLALKRLSGNKMLLSSQVPERSYDLSKLEHVDVHANGTWTGKRTGKDVISVESLAQQNGSFDKSLEFLLSKAMIEPAIDPTSLCSNLSGIRDLGEYFYIFRPLVYVLLIRKYGRSSWKPWLLSLLVEIASISTNFDFTEKSMKKELTILEQEALKQRFGLLVYYFLRPPFYNAYTKNRITSLAEWAGSKPLLSMVGAILNDYTPLWENYHFYTCGI